MGSKCCVPQNSNINNLINYNNNLRNLVIQKLVSQNNKSKWAQSIKQYIRTQGDQYLYKLQYQLDVTQLIGFVKSSNKHTSTVTRDDDFSKNLENSCLVAEDVIENASNQTTEQDINSFSLKMQKNASLMMQFDTIFKPFLEDGPYKQNIKLFLRWVSKAEKHLESGFLKPFYSIMAEQAKKLMTSIKTNDPEILLKKLGFEIQMFVKLMYDVYFAVYNLGDIIQSQKGKIFKEENINHFIICKLFITNDFMKALRDELLLRERSYIQAFEMKLNLLESHSFQFFNIPPKFQLISRNSILELSNSITSVNSYQSAVNTLKKILSSKTPISKLKILLQVQKQIVKDIDAHYKQINQPPPEIDSDTITSLTMFVVVKSKVKELPTELRIVETFSSRNALNSISGYYISTFNVAISMIDAVEQ